MYRAAALLSLASAVRAQQVGTNQAETHPKISWQTCASSGCTTNAGEVVIDANWRWVHNVGGYQNCYTGNTWDTSIATSDAVAATACALDGADYSGTYGITSSGNALTLKFVTQGSSGANIGSRTYLMQDENTYQVFKPLGKEFSFDVDLSNVPCGLNAALYFVSMDADGGKAKYTNNKAGAKYGTGYCDSQCPRDLKFINGEGNVEGWTPSTNDKNAGIGNYGSCCAEFDVWESNKISAALTPHPCTTSAQTRCSGNACGGTYSSDRYAGICDPDGCDFNSYRMGNKTFYGPGLTVNTNSKFTVTTQFITGSNGALSQIKRFYVQNGKAIPNSVSDITGVTGNSITDSFCAAQKAAFGDTTSFQSKGGLAQMSDALNKGMVLVMSLWDDHYANMLWLDSNYPTDADPSTPGVARGTCSTSSGKPADVESANAGSSVIYSNIRFGAIGTTTGGVTVPV